MKYRLISISLLLTLLSACTKEVLEEEIPAGETVSVSLKFTESPVTIGYGPTKSIAYPVPEDTDIKKYIKNLCILQFNGTGDDATLVGDVHYLTEDNTDENKKLAFDANVARINLVASSDAVHTLVFFTNTFVKLAKFRTLGDLKKATKNISSQADLLGYDSTVSPTESAFPDDRTYYYRLNGFVETVVKQDTPITCNLKRSMAKITVKIDNDGTDNLKILNVQLKNVPKTARYFTNYEGFQDSFDPTRPQRMDYPVWDMPAAIGENVTQNDQKDWYVPSNMRGIDESNSLEERKNTSKYAEGATYVQINGEYSPKLSDSSYSDERIPITYTFYLGEDLVKDFNIKPNTLYTYTFKFRGKGDASVDNRIEDMEPYDFELDSNCYMLKPPSFGSRSYTFNVVHRPNVFWGASNVDGRYGLNGEYPNNTIGPSNGWKARILWSDFEMTQEQANAFLAVKEGTGSGSYMDACQRVKITVPAGCQGNALIGVYRANSGEDDILWSWHLWITSYVPDACSSSTPEAGRYVYAVPGGEVHRYGGTAWTSGIYSNGFAMDRNIGCASQNANNGGLGGGMYYQYGRKDPFPAYYTVYRYAHDGTPTSVKSISAADSQESGSTGKDYKNVPFSVQHPTGFLKESDNYKTWTKGGIFNPEPYNKKIVWNDPNVQGNEYTTCTDFDEKLTVRYKEFAKSIFDPCPPGWSLPKVSCYEGLNTDNSRTGVEEINGYNRGYGLTYYPGGYVEGTGQQTVFFPATGYISYRSGEFHTATANLYAYYWYSTATSTHSGQNLMFYTDSPGFSITSAFERKYGIVVRCVTE